MNALQNKLAFNRFHVTFYNHESRVIEKQSFPTVEKVLARKFTLEEFPDAKTFAENLFDVFGDVVGMIKDNRDNVLYNNMEEMQDIYDCVGNWP